MKALLTCLALIASTSVPAQAPAKTVATRAEYGACLDSAEESRARQAALQKRRTDYDAAARQLQVDLKAHLEARDTIKAGTRLADSWNATSERLNARSAALNAEASVIEKDVAEHNHLSNEARARCSDLQVMPADREAVLQQRGKKP